MNDAPASVNVDMAALAAIVDPVPTLGASITRLVATQATLQAALSRMGDLGDHLLGPTDRAVSSVVADGRPGMAVTMANIAAMVDEAAALIINEVARVERALH